MAQFPDNYFQLAICDPPYFSGPDKLGYYGASITKVGVKRKGYKVKHWKIPDKSYFNELLRISKHQIIWGCNYYAKHIPAVGRIVWDKVNGDSTFSDAEIASTSTHDSTRMFSYMWNGFMQGVSLSKGKTMKGNKKLNEKRIHPTQKPVQLYKWILHNYAKPDFKIIDTHVGSGSSIIAFLDFGCEWIGFEIDKDYHKVASKRIEIHKQQLKLF